ncbi:hypothetical protein CO230_09755 [Chryseobacterium sp. 6424]|uniref:TPM domain-containing protein n=1 Tax=Chryseobacterium sp. 6424 TaxID=2039166 RepID=UPI000EFAFFF8|nr:TPM domain-containing protein [Chryseobacterium sp. 6424]AYO58379.1 hypothetical protein CO230_09755 [Chryseobacterium sp. 6424]
MSNFLTEQQMASLVEAIQSAEKYSTGEIRVHIDSYSGGNNAEIAFDVFKTLCQNQTAEKNAVLFHINFDEHYLTIIGDEGIHAKVHQQFWDQMHDRITASFARGNYFEGLRNAILETGQELKKHFPLSGENRNELPNEITFS